jgi:hypothetical protein
MTDLIFERCDWALPIWYLYAALLSADKAAQELRVPAGAWRPDQTNVAGDVTRARYCADSALRTTTRVASPRG